MPEERRKKLEYKDMGRLAGKVAIVTGALSGLGAADVELMAKEGAIVVFTGRHPVRGREMAEQIPNTLFLEQDVRDEQRWKSVIAETVQRFGGLHILVNNAGFVHLGTIEACTLDDFRQHQQVMLEGAFLGCKYAIPAMTKSGGGSIINVASIAGIKGVSSIPAYCAAKAGLMGLTRSIAVHCQEKGYGIRVNVVAPGAHDTPMTQKTIGDLTPDDASVAHLQALGQGRPIDVAYLVTFLASDESRQITGTVMVIDNGETMK
jgi:3(or 17)beta-hydroxysteroid dehydrogenase